MQPMQRMAASKSRRRSWPQTVTRPKVGRIRPTSMRMVVVLPAPFGPRKPKTSPCRSWKETLTRPKVGRIRPTSMRMVVVLPAPFGPRKPKTSPCRSWKETLSTMRRWPMILVRLSATSATGSMAFACVIVSRRKRRSWYRDRPMRRALYWIVPVTAALIAVVAFAAGFIDYLRGDVGEPVTIAPRSIESTPPRGILSPLVMGDSLARGAGDESGPGIGGRLLDELHHRRIVARTVTNIAINGARTGDVLQKLQSHNVQEGGAQANVIVLSIGGNDLWTDYN